ncbi:hypothetical protein KI387_024342, partial [Taxus chinensis]
QLVYDMPVSIPPTLTPTSASASTSSALPSSTLPPVVSQLGPTTAITTASMSSITPT